MIKPLTILPLLLLVATPGCHLGPARTRTAPLSPGSSSAKSFKNGEWTLEEVELSPHTGNHVARFQQIRGKEWAVGLSEGQTVFLPKRESLVCDGIVFDGDRPLVMLRFTQPDPEAPPFWFMLPP